ncbi:hypothetical protein [Bradyrhizobium sp. C9]|uniref:hypothetical protein n=1 Tax=Bradyrhizobium sp. C9 TaxID=142585 RepID=UPI0011773F27|nr:hypothetical protein [Bradyrhizobium sp. C9]
MNLRYVTPQLWWGQITHKSRSPRSVHALDDLAKIWCLEQVIGVAPTKAAMQAVMESEDIGVCRARAFVEVLCIATATLVRYQCVRDHIYSEGAERSPDQARWRAAPAVPPWRKLRSVCTIRPSRSRHHEIPHGLKGMAIKYNNERDPALRSGFAERQT